MQLISLPVLETLSADLQTSAAETKMLRLAESLILSKCRSDATLLSIACNVDTIGGYISIQKSWP